MNDQDTRGKNPFDRFVLVEGLKHPEKVKPNSFENQWARMARVREIADEQRKLTLALMEQRSQSTPTPQPRPTPPPSAPKPKQRWLTAHKAWLILWFFLWIIPSLAALKANVLGGLIVMGAWFWVCMFCARAPELYAGVLSDSGRNTHGSAV